MKVSIPDPLHMSRLGVLTLTHSTDARRYFKQSEIILYRQAPELAGNGQEALPAPPPENASKIAAVPA